MLSVEDKELFWVAGFLEGEGSFVKSKNSITVEASQVQLQPLEKMQRLLGGYINHYQQKKVNHSDFYRWAVHGMTAEELMKILFPLMSPKRQAQITACLSFYVTLPGRNFNRLPRKFCRHGLHAWDDTNIMVDHRGDKFCQPCKMSWQRKRRSLNLHY